MYPHWSHYYAFNCLKLLQYLKYIQINQWIGISKWIIGIINRLKAGTTKPGDGCCIVPPVSSSPPMFKVTSPSPFWCSLHFSKLQQVVFITPACLNTATRDWSRRYLRCRVVATVATRKASAQCEMDTICSTTRVGLSSFEMFIRQEAKCSWLHFWESQNGLNQFTL